MHCAVSPKLHIMFQQKFQLFNFFDLFDQKAMVDIKSNVINFRSQPLEMYCIVIAPNFNPPLTHPLTISENFVYL